MGAAPAQFDPRAAAARLRHDALQRRRDRQIGTRAGRPDLRLAGHRRADTAPLRSADRPADAPEIPAHQQLRGASDPRWILAVRTAASLQGAVLAPEKREKLVTLGRSMGLTPFDANLVIAIVQDQARRGVLASYCPQAAAAQLAMVPTPRRHRPATLFSLRPSGALHTAVAAAALLMLQALVVWLLVR